MIDFELKEKLLEGLQDAVSNYNSGMDEETSVAKAAFDHSFNKAQTERLCELYNTSRTLHHFEHNMNKKAEAFHLVDKDEVLNLLFDTSNEKMASEFNQFVDASPDYLAPETDFYFCKSAEEFDFAPVFSKTENDIPDLNANAIRMYKQTSRLQKEAEHLNAEAGIEFEKAHESLSKLARSIVADYSSGNIQKVAAVIGLLAEPENIGVFDSVSRYLPSYVMDCNVKLAGVIDDRKIAEEADLIKKINDCINNAKALYSASDKKIEECKKASAAFDELVLGHVKGGRSVNEMDRFITGDFKFGDSEKSANAVNTGLLALALGSMPGYVSDLRARPKAVDKEVDDANKRFTNMHREMILTDLINNDKYLSEEDPRVIAGYYSHFAELSPELANNKEVVRSVLRQAVHNGGGGYSTFDAGSFLDAEKTLHEVRGTLPPKHVKKDWDDDEDDRKA